MSRFSILAAVLLAACGGTSVQGEIDGETVGLDDAFFVQESGFYDDGDDLVHIVAGGAGGDLCQRYVELEELYEDLEDGDDSDDIVAWWADNLPEDFWQVDIYLRLDDMGDPDEELEGADWDEGLREDGEANGSFTHFLQPLDDDFWDGDVRIDDYDEYYESYLSDGGDVQVTGFSEDERISGRFQTDVVDWQGDSEGEVEVSFSATRCVDIEKYYF